jgi:branched-chain amino acid transport system substrate-binding protein
MRRGLTGLLVVAVGLSAAGCGSRLSHDRLVTAAGGHLEITGSPRSVPTGVGSAPLSTASSAAPAAGAGGGSNTGGAGSTGPSPTSSAGPSGGATNSPKGTGAGAACSGASSPIVIGSVGEISGLAGSNSLDGVNAVRAWVSDVNARGGIACHPVNYLVADDGGNPSTAQSEVKKFVEQDHVVAFVYMTGALTGQSTQAYIAKHQIPVIGSEGGENEFYTSAYYFPQASSGDQFIALGIYAAADNARAHQMSAIGTLSCVEAAVCTTLYKNAPALAAQRGTNVVYQGQTSLGTPDYTANCLSAKSAGVQMFIIALDANSLLRVAKNCSTVGFHPTFATLGSNAEDSLTSNPALDRMVAGIQTIPPFATGNAAVAHYRSVLGQHLAGARYSFNSILGWTAAQLFGLAVSRVKDPTTSAAILTGLYSVKHDDLGGLTAPLTFTRGRNAPATTCWWAAVIADGEYTSPNGATRTCIGE